MFRQIIVENFKIFGDRQVADLAPLTLLYGPNSGGKSSLVQALLLLKQTLENTDPWVHNAFVTRGPLTDAGPFKGLLHRQDASRTLRIGVTCTLRSERQLFRFINADLEGTEDDSRYEQVWADQQEALTAIVGLTGSDLAVWMKGCCLGTASARHRLQIQAFARCRLGRPARAR